MEFVVGFIIAFAIATTGVGAGTIASPLMILLLHVPISLSVGTALVYATLVKLIVLPVQIWRKQVVYKVLGFMLLGGVPGVIFGSLAFRKVASHGGQAILYAALGSIIVISSGFHLYHSVRPKRENTSRPNRHRWVSALMLPIGAEVGFSSSGAGALGTVALLSLTSLAATQVVGTDVAFGFVLSLIGGGLHVLSGNYDFALLAKLIVGGIAGAIVGCGLAPRLPNRQLRTVLSLWLILIGLQLCYQALKLAAPASHPSTVAAQVRPSQNTP